MKLPRVSLSQAILAFALLTVPFTATVAQNASPAPLRVVLQGHDPVAYFTEGKPVKGSAKFSYDWDEARYYFASAANRDLFAGDPDRYAPQFAGYCTASMTRGVKAEGDPETFAIVDGKLYLIGAGKGKEVAMRARERLTTDPTMIATAEKKWAEARK